jgi:hypothetical protein
LLNSYAAFLFSLLRVLELQRILKESQVKVCGFLDEQNKLPNFQKGHSQNGKDHGATPATTGTKYMSA